MSLSAAFQVIFSELANLFVAMHAYLPGSVVDELF